MVLNKIDETSLIPLGDRKLSWEQLGHRDQIPIDYPQWRITTDVLKVRGWRVNFAEFLLRFPPESLFTSALDAESMSPATSQSAGRSKGCRNSRVIQWGGSDGAPKEVLGPWGLPPSGGPRFLWKSYWLPQWGCKHQGQELLKPGG